MKPEIKKYLFDILTSIDSIYDYIGSKRDFFAYKESKVTRRAVEREIEIIGEAMNKMIKIDSSIIIKNSREIIDTRNWVIHGYDKVDDVIIWGIISIHLPDLRNEVVTLLKSE